MVKVQSPYKKQMTLNLKTMFNKAQEYLIRTELSGGFNPNQYALLLKQDIDAKLKYELWKFREEKSDKIKSTYAACNHIMTLVEKAIKEF